MSIAAAQYSKFREQVARDGRVFTFFDDGYLVFRVDGKEVIPFWSSRSRLEQIQKRNVKYTAYSIKELPLREFMNWLPKLQKEGVYIGANWSGQRLTGYDVSPNDLISAINYCLDRLKT